MPRVGDLYKWTRENSIFWTKGGIYTVILKKKDGLFVIETNDVGFSSITNLDSSSWIKVKSAVAKCVKIDNKQNFQPLL